MKIAYIELDTHAEIADNFRKIMENSQKISADYYFSEKILRILGKQEGQNIIKVSAENLLKLLENRYYDAVIIGTAHRYYNVFQKVVELFPTAIIGHNLNFIKAKNSELFLNIFQKEVRFRLKLALKEGLFLKNKIYANAQILVLDPNLATEKKVYFPLFFNDFLAEKKEDIFRIVIAGAVSQKRRDYHRVIEKIKTLKTEKKLEFVFLGKAENEELEWLQNLEKALKAKNQNLKTIVYFTEKISQNIFDEYLKKSDILWCPIQPETEFLGVWEFYGKTKISGNIGDAMRFGKWAFFPKSYPCSHFFMKNEEDLDAFLENPQKMEEKKWENYRKDKILVELEKIILNFVEMNKNNGK